MAVFSLPLQDMAECPIKHQSRAKLPYISQPLQNRRSSHHDISAGLTPSQDLWHNSSAMPELPGCSVPALLGYATPALLASLEALYTHAWHSASTHKRHV